MVRTPDNLAFAERLQAALTRSAKRITTPSELALHFNLAYAGDPITNQAAQHWLAGNNLPSRDKIETLARMLNVPYRWLRFGISEPHAEDRSGASDEGDEVPPDASEKLFLKRYRKLSAYQRELVTGLVEQLVLERDFWSPRKADQGGAD